MKQSEGVITENFEVILEQSNKILENRLRVGTLSRVISVDTANRTLIVQPIVMEKINSKTGEKYIKLPEIHNVPYIAGQYPKVDDYVVCIHLDRTKSGIDLLTDITSFIESNTNRHNLNDCVAIVINTKDEWKLIGEYSEVIQNINVSNYREIRAFLVHDNIQIGYGIIDLKVISGCKIGAVSPQKNAEFNVVDNKLNITDLSSDCTLVLCGR